VGTKSPDMLNTNIKSLSDLKTQEVVANIRKIREFRNYTQDYLAAKLNISQNAYSKIELGYSSITLHRLIEITEILEISLIELINYSGEDISQMKFAVKAS
jgi:transcriptional regulator with XRE-family HTH domain